MDETSPSSPLRAMLPGSEEPIVLPDGWRVAEDTALLVLIGPEQDLCLALATAPSGTNPEEAALQAWHLWNGNFSFPVLQQSEAPSNRGWDKVWQIVYNMPASTSRQAIAIVRVSGAAAYVALLEGAKAAFGRRMAQVSEILEAWKPANLNAVDLSTRAPQPWSERQTAELEAFIEDAMKQLLIPGVSIAIVQGGKVVCARGFGVRRIGSSEPVTPATRFMIGSSTKPLTSLMMARLIDQGYFTWSTPVRDLLPGFQLGDPEITSKLEMRHTVCACTGMPRRDLDFIFKGASPEQRLAEMSTMRPTTGFGETFQYSNLLVSAGGYAAARSFEATGSLASAYQHAMSALVFAPLDMRDTFLRQEEANSGDAATPHATDFHEQTVPIHSVLEHSVDSVAPAGAVWSTALDMASYLLLELRLGKDSKGQQLVSPEVLQSRWRGGIKITNTMSYGLGLLNEQEHGLQVISHGGNTFGFTSDMFFLPAHELGVVVLSNLGLANSFVAAVHRRILEFVFGAEPKAGEIVALATKSRHEKGENRRGRIKEDPASTAWLADFVGRYQSEQLGPANISQTESGYRIEFENWESALGAEIQPAGDRLLALTSAPWSGTLKFQAISNAELLLDAGQEKYFFRRS